MTRDEWKHLLDLSCDALTRAAYADWLEELGDEEGAADQRRLAGVYRERDSYCFHLAAEDTRLVLAVRQFLENPHAAGYLQPGDVLVVRCPDRAAAETIYLHVLRETHERGGVGEAGGR